MAVQLEEQHDSGETPITIKIYFEIPNFYGRSSVRVWVKQCEKCFSLLETPNEQKVDLAYMCMFDKAYVWARDYIGNNLDVEWPEFARDLCDQFGTKIRGDIREREEKEFKEWEECLEKYFSDRIQDNEDFFNNNMEHMDKGEIDAMVEVMEQKSKGESIRWLEENMNKMMQVIKEELQVKAVELGKAQTCPADFVVNILADEDFDFGNKGEGAVDALGGFLIDSGCVSYPIEVPPDPPDLLSQADCAVLIIDSTTGGFEAGISKDGIPKNLDEVVVPKIDNPKCELLGAAGVISSLNVFDEFTDFLLDNELEEYVSNEDVDRATNEADAEIEEVEPEEVDDLEEINELKDTNDSHSPVVMIPAGKQVAVKRENPATLIYTNNWDFEMELEIFRCLRNTYMVNLWGYCAEMGDRLLVSQSMPHGTLHEHLHGCKVKPLPWRDKTEVVLLKPPAPRLSELLRVEVKMKNDCIGEEVKKLVSEIPDRGVILPENVRFYKEEEQNDPELAKKLAFLAYLYVNDAFGTAHRGYASTEGVTKFLKPFAAGFFMQRELDYIVGAVSNPKKPFAAIVGGSKVYSKIGVIESLLAKVDILILGGEMIFTFYKAQGLSVGSSLVEEDKFDLATSLLKKAKSKGVFLLRPTDVVMADKLLLMLTAKLSLHLVFLMAGWVCESSIVFPFASIDRLKQVDGKVTSQKKFDLQTRGIRGSLYDDIAYNVEVSRPGMVVNFGFNVKNVAVKDLKCGYVTSTSKDDPANHTSVLDDHMSYIAVKIFDPGGSTIFSVLRMIK